MGDQLAINVRLWAGNGLRSKNGNYRLDMQRDGNLVLYSNSSGYPLWATNTSRTGDRNFAILLNDGNLCVYNAKNERLWSSTTTVGRLQDNYRLIVQDDGNVAIFTPLPADASIWNTNTSRPPTGPGAVN